MDNNSTPDKQLGISSEENDFYFSFRQKELFVLVNIFITLIIVVVLQITISVKAPLLLNQKVNDVAPLTRDFILFLQFICIFGFLPLNIYDILKNKYVTTIKETQKYLLLISALVCLLLILFLLNAALSINTLNIPNSSNLYLGPPPEVLITAILFSVVLYNLPGYALIKYYKL